MDDESMISMIHMISRDDCCSNEESGWSSYLEDFPVGLENECDSMVSEAACSSGSKKYYSDHHRLDGECYTCERGSFKRRKTQVVYADPDLEDTATSSPAFSPKEEVVSCNKTGEGTDQILLGKESSCKELRTKGLCLVPFSDLFNGAN